MSFRLPTIMEVTVVQPNLHPEMDPKFTEAVSCAAAVRTSEFVHKEPRFSSYIALSPLAKRASIQLEVVAVKEVSRALLSPSLADVKLVRRAILLAYFSSNHRQYPVPKLSANYEAEFEHWLKWLPVIKNLDVRISLEERIKIIPDLSSLTIRTFAIYCCKNLRHINGFSKLKIEKLVLSQCDQLAPFNGLGKQTSLKRLEILFCKLAYLLPDLRGLTGLEHLELSFISGFPEDNYFRTEEKIQNALEQLAVNCGHAPSL